MTIKKTILAASLAVAATFLVGASAAEQLVTETFKLDITPQSVVADGGARKAVINRIPAAKKAKAIQYQPEGENGGTATIQATHANMAKIEVGVAAYMERPQYVATLIIERDGKPVDCADGCKVSEPEGLSEVRQVLKDVGKIGDTQFSDQVSINWHEHNGQLQAHIIADYEEGNEEAKVDVVEVVKINERSMIYLDGEPHMRIVLKIEPSKG